MTNCINCGQSIPKTVTQCPYCGATQEERTVLLQDDYDTTSCIDCGKSIPKSAATCPYCGAAQEERTILLQDEPQPQTGYINQQAQRPMFTEQQMSQPTPQPMPQQVSQPVPQQGYNQYNTGVETPAKKSNTGLIAGIVAAVVVCVVVALIILL